MKKYGYFQKITQNNNNKIPENQFKNKRIGVTGTPKETSREFLEKFIVNTLGAIFVPYSKAKLDILVVCEGNLTINSKKIINAINQETKLITESQILKNKI